MMDRSEKIKMYLNIGDQRITLTVPYERQEFVRATERGVDALYRKWRKSFPAKTDSEILAMVAYQYAAFYGELNERQALAAAIVQDCLSLLGDDKDAEQDPDADAEEDEE